MGFDDLGSVTASPAVASGHRTKASPGIEAIAGQPYLANKVKFTPWVAPARVTYRHGFRQAQHKRLVPRRRATATSDLVDIHISLHDHVGQWGGSVFGRTQAIEHISQTIAVMRGKARHIKGVEG